MQKITLFLGLNDKDTKRQELTTIDAFKIVNNIIKDCTNRYKSNMQSIENCIKSRIHCG